MWLTLIDTETISASSGVGYMAMQARELLLVDVVVLAIGRVRAVGVTEGDAPLLYWRGQYSEVDAPNLEVGDAAVRRALQSQHAVGRLVPALARRRQGFANPTVQCG
jgi:hypothetical protein